LKEKEKEVCYYQMIKLQNRLKNNVLMTKNGSFFSKFGVSSGIELRFKEMLTKEVNDMLVEYNKLYLKTRENNEKIRKRLDKV
jgi:hypothetical protein